MKFIAIIPARYASTRFPGKPLSMIGGVSMIERVCRQVSLVFDRVVVATDDDRIARHVEGFGGNVVMTRPDHKSGTDRISEVYEKLALSDHIVINVQGDEPFIAVSQLEQIRSLFDDPECQIATLAKPFAQGEDIFNPNAVKALLSPSGSAIYFSRSAVPFLRGVEPSEWSSAHTYYKHIGLYGYRGDVLLDITKLPQSELEKCESLEQLRWLEAGYRVKVAITHENSYGIDTPEDLAAAEKMLIDRGPI